MPPALSVTTPQEVPPARWSSHTTHAFAAQRDIRDLLVVQHPWVPSRAGGVGAWTAKVAAPHRWHQGQPLFISFYELDNYSGFVADSPWVGVQVFAGHRFKQLLVNGQVAWEQDVADEHWVGDPKEWFAAAEGKPAFSDPYRAVDITRWARPEMELTLRVIDKVASTIHLPGDQYRRFSWSVADPREAQRNFHTIVYFGDVHLSGSKRPVRRVTPAGPSVAPPKAAVSPRGDRRPIPSRGIPLRLVTAGKLPAPGFPVRCGVPLPRGAVPAGTPFALAAARGRSIPLATTELSHWPDGSIQWVLCEFVATAGGDYRLRPGRRPVAPRRPVRVRKSGGRIVVSSGALKLTLGGRSGAGVFESIESSGGLRCGAMDLSLKLNRVGWRDHFTARRRRVVVEKVNDLCATVLVEGDMRDAKGRRFGPWRARLHLWAGLPYLLVDWTLVNESDQAMAMILEWSARLGLPDLAGAITDFGPFTAGYDLEDINLKAIPHRADITNPRSQVLHADLGLSCMQERVNQARIYRNTSWVATTELAAGFVNLQHTRGSVVGAMRWFAEEFPKGILVRPKMLTLATMPEADDAVSWGHDRPFVRLGRGEAKRQTFALWLDDAKVPASQAQRFNGCVQDAPRLFDSAWFTQSRVIESGPPRGHPALKAWARIATPQIERTGIHCPRPGHREYWDTAWSNDYRGRSHMGLIQFFETGDPRWLRYFDAAITHNRDVDIIQFCPEHPDWIGAVHSYGEDHTSAGPMGNIGSNCDGMIDHYLLTGDPDSWAAAAGLARRLLTCPTRGRCAREVGWPISQLARWYDLTGDARFKRKMEQFMDAARAYVEPRRGVFDEVHGSCNYRGPVAFMVGYLGFGLIRHHQSTGDPRTLALLHSITIGLFAETCTETGRFRYSPSPECNLGPSGANRSRGWNGLVGGMAGYVALHTGDRRCAAWARECYDAVVEESPDPGVTMDMLTTAGWMLRAVAALPRSVPRHR